MQATSFVTDPAPSRPFTVQRWPTEVPLFVLSVLVSIPLCFLLCVSVIGLAYAALIGVALFFVHVGLVARVRGSGVRVSPDQFPALHDRVRQIARDMGIPTLPDIYLLQAGGTLNAFATKFFGAHLVVLYAELLDACGEDTAARDMIIAHELGHIHAGHLRWRWLTMPALLVPFLGHALSRAREYTCDRYGAAGCGDPDGALRGLTILAAGPKLGKAVSRAAFVRQAEDLQTGWMTLGEWLGTHPPLAKRVGALAPELARSVSSSSRGPLRALGILMALFLPLAAAGVVAAVKLPGWLKQRAAVAAAASPPVEPDPFAAPFGGGPLDLQAPPPERTGAEAGEARAQVEEDFRQLSNFLEEARAAHRPLPWDALALRRFWSQKFPDTDYPEDAFASGGAVYRYDRNGEDYLLSSVGPDGEPDSDDDLVFDSRVAVPLEKRHGASMPSGGSSRPASGTRH